MGTSLYNKWIEIDLDAVKSNLAEVNSLLEEKVRLIAVVKADAYGHGAAEVARILYQNGVDFFAVSYLEEALELRRAGIRSSIMLFGPVIDEREMVQAIDNHITLSITSQFESQLLNKVSLRLNKPVTVHLKMDTGLGRFGLTIEEILEVCYSLKDNSCVYIEGIYTHMAQASNEKYTIEQFNKFMQAVNDLENEGFAIPVKHCANSTVFLKYPHMHLNAVRIGTLLSGQYPVGKFSQVLSIKDPYKFKSRIISVRTLEKGRYLGYFRTYRLKQKAQVAVIPVGFNDGLALEVSNRPTGLIDLSKTLVKRILAYLGISRFSLMVRIKGNLYPVRGKVFMQMALVEIPLGVNVKIGDEVEVPVRKTLVAKNLPRLYLTDGAAGKIGQQDRTTYLIEEG